MGGARRQGSRLDVRRHALCGDGMPFRRLADLDDRQRRQHAARTDAVLQGSAALEKRLDGTLRGIASGPTNCRPSDSGTNTPNRRDRIRPVAPNRSRKSKDSADSNFSSTSPTPRKRVICPRTGAYDTRPKQEKALHGCVQGLFSHPAILVTSESETGSCARHAGRGGATRARTHPGAKVDSRPGGRDDACCAYPPRSNREDSDEVPENIAVRN